MKIDTLEKANEVFKKIPGISKKLAEKISTFILNQSTDFSVELVNAIQDIKDNIVYCSQCNFIRENNKCLNCDDPLKMNSLMIVESITTLIKIDEMGIFFGFYFVLPELLSVKQKNDYKYEYQQLFEFIGNHNFDEIMIVLSPSLEGEMTTAHLQKLLQKRGIKATRAAIGMPMGSNLEYLDPFTIKQAIKNRNI
ncbi:toprim domain-containing protein [Mycoplasma zalophidermidis]|uniref:Recombination protein RecR n=1 Tax=Mycoplasma zalophidermidis TaxID=398174 RepID=A0ABS6DQS9_9MOLU|nr:toprim domain-containing protein [Mycoplasma zalophidermidis]MBU4689482.1 toprim domain-containing protein [Mycoplasma zalophidermidis]MBU4693360.1 toprim domain-containing protein [Mycoplasma zalophidermidis]MCR8966342.1 toprim domain-containing protein [Mycoplasma zalophidermidis]